MQLDDARQRFLVAAGQIPGDRHARPARSLEYDPISLDHLLGGKDTSERIVHVNVRITRRTEPAPERSVFHLARQVKPFQNFFGAIAKVLIAVENQDPPYGSL